MYVQQSWYQKIQKIIGTP